MYREWSFPERQLFQQSQNLNAWDPDNCKPVFTDPPVHDSDFFTRLRAAVPNYFTYSMTMLDAESHAKDAEQKPFRQEMQNADVQLALRTGDTKLFTDEGKPICIVTMEVTWKVGTHKDLKSGMLNTQEVKSVWRGDKFTAIPLQMIENLINCAFRKSGFLKSARLFYNRDSKYTSGKNLFWHFDFVQRKHVVDAGKLDELKLLLR